MTMSFAVFVEQEDPDRRVLEETMKGMVFESADYLPEEEMLQKLDQLIGGPDTRAQCLDVLGADVPLRHILVYRYLESVWDGPGGPERVRQALLNTQQRLPVLDVALIATALMYGLWLQETGGVKNIKEHQEKRPDGTEIADRELTNYPFAHPLREFLRSFLGKGQE